MYTIYPPNDYRLYLSHHGIKGMKWGVMNGPPYPLGESNHSASEVKAGWKSSLKKSKVGSTKSSRSTANDIDDYGNRKGSDKSELYTYMVALGLGVVTLSPSLVIPSAIRFAQASSAKKKTKKVEDERSQCKVDKKTGYHVKNKEYTKKEDMASVNPSFKNFDSNTKNNCMLCTVAYDLRRRGYEVSADVAKYGYNQSDAAKWYKEAKLVKVADTDQSFKNFLKYKTGNNSDVTKKVKSELLKQGDGARGNLMMVWDWSGSGHSVAYEVDNGKIILRDCQNNKIHKPEQLLNFSVGASYVRLDNVEPDFKKIKKEELVR